MSSKNPATKQKNGKQKAGKTSSCNFEEMCYNASDRQTVGGFLLSVPDLNSKREE